MAKRNRDNTTQLRRLIEGKCHAGLSLAAETHAREFSEDVNIRRVSKQGQFPGWQTGQGQGAIGWEISARGSPGEVEARSGVTHDGMHLVDLEFGVNPRTGEPFSRKGMDHTFNENIEAIRQAFINGSESVASR